MSIASYTYESGKSPGVGNTPSSGFEKLRMPYPGAIVTFRRIEFVPPAFTSPPIIRTGPGAVCPATVT